MQIFSPNMNDVICHKLKKKRSSENSKKAKLAELLFSFRATNSPVTIGNYSFNLTRTISRLICTLAMRELATDLFPQTAMKGNSSGSAFRNLSGVQDDTFDVEERRLDH